MGKDNMMLWIMGIILIGALFCISQPEEDVGLVIYYYKNGEEVFPQKKLFSIVGGESFDQFSFDIYASNTGETDIYNMQIISASPSSFYEAFSKTNQTLVKGQSNKLLWSSSLINTTQFESYSQPVRFWVNISGLDEYTQKIIYKTAYIDLAITPDIPTEEEPECVGGLKLCSVGFSVPCEVPCPG